MRTRASIILAASLFFVIAGCKPGENAPANGGIGVTCSTDTNCAAGLECRRDSIDFIADRQCTDFCSSSAQCQEAYGPSTFCIGANICVVACGSRENATTCPTGTFCNSFDWCER